MNGELLAEGMVVADWELSFIGARRAQSPNETASSPRSRLLTIERVRDSGCFPWARAPRSRHSGWPFMAMHALYCWNSMSPQLCSVYFEAALLQRRMAAARVLPAVPVRRTESGTP